MSGACLVETEVKPPELPQAHEIVLQASKAMKVSASRVSIWNGTEKLKYHQDLSKLQRQSEDVLELHAVADMNCVTSLAMRHGRVIAVRCAGPRRIDVEFEPGEITETHSLPVTFKHTATVRSGFNRSSEMGYNSYVESKSDNDVRSMTLSAVLPESSLEALLMLNLEISIRTQATLPPAGEQGYPRSIAHAESPFQRCGTQSAHRFLRLVAVLFVYWTLDALAMSISLVAAVQELADGYYWQGVLLLVTLWLPGFAWACRYHCYCFSRKFVGIGSFATPPVCCVCWCCGIVWLWIPLALFAGAFLVSAWHFLGLMLLLARRRHEERGPLFDLENLYLHELYKRDVRFYGELPRLMVVNPYSLLLGTANPAMQVASLVAAALASVVSILPHRRALMAESYRHFDEVTMEMVSD